MREEGGVTRLPQGRSGGVEGARLTARLGAALGDPPPNATLVEVAEQVEGAELRRVKETSPNCS